MLTDNQHPTLRAQNRDVLAKYLEPLSAEARRDALDELQNHYESRVAPAPQKPGEKAPDFDLQDQHGARHALHDHDETLVLSFYRGGWCTHCTTALRALQRREAAISTHHGKVLAISPEPSIDAKVTARVNQLRFPLLHDQGNQIADAYGLRWSIAPLLEPIYAKHGIDLPVGCDALDVPYPATIIIDRDKIVRNTFMDRDPSVRMAPEDIAAVVKQLNR